MPKATRSTRSRPRTRASSGRSTAATPRCCSGRWRTAGRWPALAVLVLLSSVPLFQIADKNFLPNDDQSEFEVGLRAAEGTAIDATEIIANRIATRIRQLPEVEFTLVTVADDPARTQNVATVYTRLKPVDQRERDQFEVMNDVRSNILPQGVGGQPADRRPAGRDDRRRRQPERGDPVHDQRARTSRSSRPSPRRSPAPRRRSRASSTSTRR